jgi:hypothetical protein
MSYKEKMREAWRLQLLILLASMPGYESGQYFLYTCMQDGDLPPPSADQVATELAWMSEQGLVKLVNSDNLATASITQRGLDVSKGFSTVPGVERPRPE